MFLFVISTFLFSVLWIICILHVSQAYVIYQLGIELVGHNARFGC